MAKNIIGPALDFLFAKMPRNNKAYQFASRKLGQLGSTIVGGAADTRAAKLAGLGFLGVTGTGTGMVAADAFDDSDYLDAAQAEKEAQAGINADRAKLARYKTLKRQQELDLAEALAAEERSDMWRKVGLTGGGALAGAVAGGAIAGRRARLAGILLGGALGGLSGYGADWLYDKYLDS